MAKKPKHVPVEGQARAKGLPFKRVPASAKSQAQTRLIGSGAGKFHVRWNYFDFDGPWCLGQSEPPAIVDLMKRLKDFETMRPLEIFGTTKSYLGTDYDVAALPNAGAENRITALGFSDQTQISALRIGSKPRFFGFRVDPDFYAIFWDPEHEIWPSPLRHT